MREISYADAIMEAFRGEMRRDEKVFHICGNLGPCPAWCRSLVSNGYELPQSRKRPMSGRGWGWPAVVSGRRSALE